MAKFNGTEFKAFIVGTPNKALKGTTGLDITISVAEIDVSTKDSLGWKNVIGGQRSWSGSVTGIVDYTEGANEAGLSSLIALEIDRIPIAFTFASAITGTESYTGTALLTNVDWGAPMEDKMEWTADLTGSGAIVPADVV